MISKKVQLSIVSILFGISCLIGYIVENEYTMIINGIISVIDSVVFYIIIYGINKSFRIILKNIPDTHLKKGNEWFKLFVFFWIIWMACVIARYPGIQSGGVLYQFQQFVGEDTFARYLSPIVYENHYITGHHPVALTYLFGLFIKWGIDCGFSDAGMFLLACFVCSLNALFWSFTLNCFGKDMDERVWKLLILFFGLNPLIISLNTYVLKDNLFAASLGVYAALIYKCTGHSEKKKAWSSLIVCSIIIPFLKNQGIYIVVLTALALILITRKHIKYWVRCLFFPFLVYQILFQMIIMPFFKIAPGGKQEMFTIFCQTTANTINRHPELLKSEDYRLIYEVFPVDDWTVYNPSNSDAIKFQFDQNSTQEDLKKFFSVWIRNGIKYPGAYLQAIFNQTFGYYYIDSPTSDWIWKGEEIVISDNGDINQISSPKFKKLNAIIVDFLHACTKRPRIRYLFSVPVAFWNIVVCCLIYRGKIRNLLWLFPIFLQWLICLVSPVNASGRYGMIIYETAPIMMAFVINNRIEVTMEV